MSVNSEDLEKAKFFHELASRSLVQVSESNRRIDEKIHNTLSLTATLTPVLLGLFYYLFTAIPSRQLPLFWLILLSVAAGVVLFSASAIQGFLAYRPWVFRSLDPVTFRRQFHNNDLLRIIKKSAGTIGHIADQNWQILMTKGSAHRRMLIFLISGVFAFMIAFVILVVSLWLN